MLPNKNLVSFETDCKYTAIFLICKFYLDFLSNFRLFTCHFEQNKEILPKKHYLCITFNGDVLVLTASDIGR